MERKEGGGGEERREGREGGGRGRERGGRERGRERGERGRGEGRETPRGREGTTSGLRISEMDSFCLKEATLYEMASCFRS